MKNKAAVELGKLGGLVKSEAKAKAVRENGKKGGRPKQLVSEVAKPVRKVSGDPYERI